jgi:hypothetical protein
VQPLGLQSDARLLAAWARRKVLSLGLLVLPEACCVARKHDEYKG